MLIGIVQGRARSSESHIEIFEEIPVVIKTDRNIETGVWISENPTSVEYWWLMVDDMVPEYPSNARSRWQWICGFNWDYLNWLAQNKKKLIRLGIWIYLKELFAMIKHECFYYEVCNACLSAWVALERFISGLIRYIDIKPIECQWHVEITGKHHEYRRSWRI